MKAHNGYVLAGLASALPAKINAARMANTDCVRLTVAEAQAVRALLGAPVEVKEKAGA